MATRKIRFLEGQVWASSYALSCLRAMLYGAVGALGHRVAHDDRHLGQAEQLRGRGAVKPATS